MSEVAAEARPNRDAITPRATYRLQLNRDFTFAAATKRVPYFASLGISHLYLSPIFKARPGSLHGYDVTNHDAFNPEIGTAEEFAALASAARAHGMGIILDIVPNHMAVMADDNAWWRDVLENGPAAQFAKYFDIDWRPTRESMRDRLLVPVLGQRFGDELRHGSLQIEFNREAGSFQVRYGEHCFPLDPREYPRIFDASSADESNDDEAALDVQEFLSLLDEFRRLPSRANQTSEAMARRYRDKEVFKRRLARLCARSAVVENRVEAAVKHINRRSGDASSFDAFAKLLEAQPYRLAYWRVAGDEINYRRFFDVNNLAALRIEDPEVFRATHALTLRLISDDLVEGVRIDHIDGLYDPRAYLEALRTSMNVVDRRTYPYVVVEKILAAHEQVRDDWPIDGTTGYEFGAAIVSWLIRDKGSTALDYIYRRSVRESEPYEETVYRSKKLIMRTSLAAEVAVLAGQLDRIAQSHPDTVDFTLFGLRDALTEVIAAFPVYRTYVSRDGVSAEDRKSISWAIGVARRRSADPDLSIFAFLEEVLLAGPTVEQERREPMLEFAMKFQQVTSPVMAKAVEDTAFYRDARLLALNEVGQSPASKGLSNEALHKENEERRRRRPLSMVSTSTHDSKRGEDARYRLAVLSELPREWRKQFVKWHRFNRGRRKLQSYGEGISSFGDYFFLQTILSVWPVDRTAESWEALRPRLKEYMLKATREAKRYTSWVNPNSEYEAAVSALIDDLFGEERGPRFREEFGAFAEQLAFFGMLNGLSAIVLKCTAPGVPDFYQGSELPELTFVDPDNRRGVDFDARDRLLRLTTNPFDRDEIASALASWRTGHLKFRLIAMLLDLRRTYPALFADGTYEPLSVIGHCADHLFAFARSHEGTTLVVLVSRFAATLMNAEAAPPTSGERGDVWKDTRIVLPDRVAVGGFRHLITQRSIEVQRDEIDGTIDRTIEARDVFDVLPIAVLLHRGAQ